MRTKKLPPDYWLLGATAALLAIGVVLVFDSSYARAGEMRLTGNDSWYFVKRQLIFAVIGIFGMIAAMNIKLNSYRKLALPLMLASVGLLIAVLIPDVGVKVNGAMRWFQIGPVRLQPSEIAKLALILYLAHALARQNNRIRYFGRGVMRHLIWVGIIAGLVLVEPDMGTTIVLVGVAFIMLFTAGAMKRHLFGIGALGVSLVGLMIIIEPYRWARIKVFLDPTSDYYGAGYQITQSLMALGTGGLYGVGLVEGRAKHYLPAAHTDFILATLAEEAGLIGVTLLLMLFAILTYRGFAIAGSSRSSYGALLAVGVTSLIALQTVINVGVVTSLIPTTGVPLPFISYGGSSLVFTLIAVGILLSVSRNLNEQMVEDPESDESSADRRRDRRTYISRPVRRARIPRERTRVRATVRR